MKNSREPRPKWRKHDGSRVFSSRVRNEFVGELEKRFGTVSKFIKFALWLVKVEDKKIMDKKFKEFLNETRGSFNGKIAPRNFKRGGTIN